MQIHLSNQLEKLFIELQRGLEGKDPFSSPLIVVASYGMKRWLQLEFAKKSVAFGYKVVTVDQALKTLLQESTTPTRYDIKMSLEKLLEESDQKVVLDYLEDDKNKASGLANRLAYHFGRYAIYGEDIEGWQKELYVKLPFSMIQQVMKIKKVKNCAVHLFGFSFIPPLYFSFFKKQGVHMYFISPCQTYWVETENPLLNHWGRLGKEMSKVLDEEPYLGHYDFPDGDISLLKALQCDLLFAKDPKSSENTPFDDQSLVIHEMTSRRREIERLYYELVEIAENNKTFNPHDVLIMAPDISEYFPYINTYFEGDQSPFDPLIYDVKKGDSNDSYKLLKALIRLGQSRYQVEPFHKVLELMGWDHEKLALVNQWAEMGGIIWGVNGAHRDRLLMHDGSLFPMEERSQKGTWKGGFEKVIEILLTSDEVSFKNAALLGEWIDTFERVYKSLNALLGKKRDLKGWQKEVRFFVDEWFKDNDEEELVEIYHSIDVIVTPLLETNTHPYSFSTIWERIKEVMEQKESVIGDQRLHALHFSSLHPNRAVPKRWIFLLGMDEGVFPRANDTDSLDLLTDRFIPSPRIDDRYAFLETILSAKERLSISFTKDRGASPFLLELADYLKDQFTLHWKVHPKDSFDQALFQGGYGSALFYQGTKKVYGENEAKSYQFLEPTPLKRENEQEICIEDLFRFAKDPLKAYYQKGLGLNLKDGMEEKEREPFSLSGLDRYKLRDRFSKNEDQGALLTMGIFDLVAKREVSQLEKEWSHFGFSETIEWHKGCVTPMKNIFPPLKVGPFTLYGTLEGVTPQGIIVDEGSDVLIKVWPKLLLSYFIQGVEPFYLNLRTGLKERLEVVNPEKALLNYLLFYQESLKRPTLALPDQIKALKNKSVDSYLKERVDPYMIYSPYREFAPLPLNEEEVLYWKKRVLEVYE
ncbi:exodeoxyribonuclease V subunit gamma [Chlamydiales bacterium]|nr:exodeoxyribonuclease V subunit gamma [Chlamydiales bacterium]